MYILLYVGAAIFVLTALLMVVDAFKRKVFSGALFALPMLLLACFPAAMGYLYTPVEGVVEGVSECIISTDAFGTEKWEFTVWVRNEDGGQDKIVWTGTHNDSRYAGAKAAYNPDVVNANGDERMFEYKRIEIVD